MKMFNIWFGFTYHFNTYPDPVYKLQKVSFADKD